MGRVSSLDIIETLRTEVESQMLGVSQPRTWSIRESRWAALRRTTRQKRGYGALSI